MTVARQVYAKGLQARLKSTDMVREVRSTLSLLVGGASANDDVVSYLPTPKSGTPKAPLHDSTAVRIFGNGEAVVAAMLGLTHFQSQALERNSISLTAHGYRVSEGSDALVVFESEDKATRTLHQIGFAHIKEGGTLIIRRFYKMIEAANGLPATVWVRLESSVQGDAVYAHISVLSAV
jgi:hypothetical protein